MYNTIQQTSNQDGYYRLWDILGCPKRGIPARLPIGRSSFLARVKAGTYPQPVRLSARTVAWRKSDIQALLKALEVSHDQV